MKYLILILFILFVKLNVFSQDYIIFKTDTFNLTDKQNLKQGLWLDYDIGYVIDSSPSWVYDDTKFVDISNNSCFLKTIIDSFLVIKEEGYYKNNIKIGEWKHWRTGHSGYVDFTKTFHENGNFTKTNRVDNYSYEISKDSLYIFGYVYYSDSIFFNCQNNNCELLLEDNTFFKRFSFKTILEFEYEIDKIRYGMYDYDLKRIKSLSK